MLSRVGHVRAVLGSQSWDPCKNWRGLPPRLPRFVHEGGGARRRRDANVQTMQGAKKMHEEIFPLSASQDPGRPPEEILAERSVQTEAQFHSHLPSQRAQSFQVRKYLIIS